MKKRKVQGSYVGVVALAAGLCLLNGGGIAEAEDVHVESTDTVPANVATKWDGTTSVTVDEGGVIDLVGNNLERSGDHNGNHYNVYIGTLSGTPTFYVAASVINRQGEGRILEGDIINPNALVDGTNLKLGVYSKYGAIRVGDYDFSDPIVLTKSNQSLYSDANVHAVKHTWGNKTYTPTFSYAYNELYGDGNNYSQIMVKSVLLNDGAEGNENTQTVADAKFALNDLWLAETNNMEKRMGELRGLKPAQAGAWVRYSGGNLKAGTGRQAEVKYNMGQLGYDWDTKVNDGVFYRGGAISYSKGDTTFTSGSGDVHETTLSLYQTWIGNKGHYYDVIAKAGRYSDDYNVLLDEGTAMSHGGYDTWGYSVSGEYGYRQQLGDGMYIEPQGELIWGHVDGASYKVQGSNASMDSQEHFITRLGAAYGKSFADGSNAYMKASMFHEFGSGMNVSLDNTKYSRDPARNWYEIGIGGNIKAADNCNLYAELAQDFGDLESNVIVNAGARWIF